MYESVKEGKALKELPKKLNDHGADATRMLFDTLNDAGELWNLQQA